MSRIADELHTCPHCRVPIPVTTYGTVRKHGTCPGSGLKLRAKLQYPPTPPRPPKPPKPKREKKTMPYLECPTCPPERAMQPLSQFVSLPDEPRCKRCRTAARITARRQTPSSSRVHRPIHGYHIRRSGDAWLVMCHNNVAHAPGTRAEAQAYMDRQLAVWDGFLTLACTIRPTGGHLELARQQEARHGLRPGSGIKRRAKKQYEPQPNHVNRVD